MALAKEEVLDLTSIVALLEVSLNEKVETLLEGLCLDDTASLDPSTVGSYRFWSFEHLVYVETIFLVA